MNKSKLRFVFVLALFLFTSSLRSIETAPLVITIPKSGSHLIGKTITLIPGVNFSGFDHTIKVEKIASVCGINLPRTQTARIFDRVFGVDDLVNKWNNTFISGYTGSWKNHIEEIFKINYNDFLFYFGYIDTPDW